MSAVKSAERAKGKSGTVRIGGEKLAGDGGVVAFVEESHALPLVSIVLSLRTGSAHDPKGKEGLTQCRVASGYNEKGGDRFSG